VYGNSYESTLVAIVVPDKKPLMAWAKESDLGSDFKAVCQKPEASCACTVAPTMQSTPLCAPQAAACCHGPIVMNMLKANLSGS
jgi:hypothetical protein